MTRLVEAHNACCAPRDPGGTPLTLASFKRDVRDLNVWCSSSMIALEGSAPIGVLIGAKRPEATLVRRIGVRPDLQRRGHGRHLLASLSAKLAILGPRRIVAEIPAALPEAMAFFEACGYAHETTFTDFAGDGGRAVEPPGAAYVIPTTVGDLAANGLLTDPEVICWERAAATLRGREDLLDGLALASADRIEGHVLFRRRATGGGADIAALRARDAEMLARLVAILAGRTGPPLHLPKVHAAEFPPGWLAGAGLCPQATHHLYTTLARSG